MSLTRTCPTCMRPLDADAIFCPHDGTPVAAVTDAMADPLVGALVDGRYRIAARIGAGGTAVVYRAHAIALGEDVALKVLRSELIVDERVLARFAREARATSRIAHENVVRVLDFGFAPGQGFYFLAMELLDGRSLKDLVAQQGPLPLPRALVLLTEIASGMARAHELGVVHRDLKTANVMIVAGGRAKIVDFGLSRVTGPGMASLTSTGELMGTPAYMAPELWGLRGADPRTDVYAFGVLAFEVLVGHPPFRGSSLELMEAHLRLPAPDLRALRPEIPALLSGLVARSLAKESEDRFESMSSVSEMLRTLAQHAHAPAPGFADGALTIRETAGLGESEDTAALAHEITRLRRLRDRRLEELASALWSTTPPADVMGLQREIARRERELEARSEALVLADAELTEIEERARQGEADLRLSVVDASLRRAGIVLEDAPPSPSEHAEHALASFRHAQAAELARARAALGARVRELSGQETELAPLYESLARRVHALAAKRPDLRAHVEAFGQVDGALVSLTAKLDRLGNRV